MDKVVTPASTAALKGSDPTDTVALPAALTRSLRLQVNRVRDGVMHSQAESDAIAVETPVAVELNGINHAVMLATPDDLEDFAWGFCLTEGIVRSPDDIRDIEQERTDLGIILHVQISPACMQFLKERRRQMAGRTACGLCGVETLEAVRRLPPVAPPSHAGSPASPPPTPSPVQQHDLHAMPAGLTLAQLLEAMNALREQQPLHQETGATHAAAWVSADSHTPTFIREDVGRHNALDKTIGALLRDTRPTIGHGALLVSSRASFEMVQKAAMAGCPVLAAVSAPTSAAIALAEETGITLLGFTRARQATIYAHSQRFQLSNKGKAS
ncbi:MAG TPA: sulfurtransferase FdhD [Advenella kashmirensis]|uniref:Sulfur carrier protein FdhD n=2 Tax=Advenella TaxID=290425 RepID=A0A356LF07_9BURK|nr:sulfurtransferase FdhD [Advenella kashmirensis]